MNEELLNQAIGKIITSLILVNEGDGALYMKFSDGTGLKFEDEGRQCCEERYITTEDSLSDFIGTSFYGAEVLNGSYNTINEAGSSEYYHEQEFLVISTNKGRFTLITHNEHNGYYGGFWLVVKSLTNEITSA